MSKSVSRKPFQACVRCHDSKQRCQWSTSSQPKCDRCMKSEKDCFPHISRQGQRPKNPGDKAATENAQKKRKCSQKMASQVDNPTLSSDPHANDAASNSSGLMASTAKPTSTLNDIESSQFAQLQHAAPSGLTSPNGFAALLNVPAAQAALVAANHSAQNARASHWDTSYGQLHQTQPVLANCFHNPQGVTRFNLQNNRAESNTMTTQAVLAPQLSHAPFLQGEPNLQTIQPVQGQLMNSLLEQIKKEQEMKCQLNRLIAQFQQQKQQQHEQEIRNQLIQILIQELKKQGCPAMQAVHTNHLQAGASPPRVASAEAVRLNQAQGQSALNRNTSVNGQGPPASNG